MSAGGFFVYGGASSRDYGILIDSVSGIWDTPERDSEQIEIPGRNGDLTVDNGRWKNVPGTYTCGIGVDFEKNFERFRAMITAHRGYARLEDSWHPDEYRMAKLTGNVALELIKNGAAATFAVNFSVMPQRSSTQGRKPRHSHRPGRSRIRPRRRQNRSCASTEQGPFPSGRRACRSLQPIPTRISTATYASATETRWQTTGTQA